MGGMFLRRKYQKKSTIVVGIALALIVSTITAFFHVPLLKQTSKEFISEQGYTCSRKNQDPDTGCCPPEPPRYICTGCQRASHCCEHFEFCVSCCLSKESPSEQIRNMERLKIYDLASSDTFEVCAVACKSHSGSVLHENSYRSPYHHCYEEERPPTMGPQDGPTSGLFSFLSISGSNQSSPTNR